MEMEYILKIKIKLSTKAISKKGANKEKGKQFPISIKNLSIQESLRTINSMEKEQLSFKTNQNIQGSLRTVCSQEMVYTKPTP